MKSKGLLFLGGFLAIVFLDWFVYALTQAEPEVQSGILAVVGSISVAIWSHRSAKKREIEARHFAEKRAAYMECLDAFFGVLGSKKGIGPAPVIVRPGRNTTGTPSNADYGCRDCESYAFG